MALQIDYTDATGTQHSQAYARIEEISIKYEGKALNLYVGIYHNATARSKSDSNATKKHVKTIGYSLINSDYTNHVEDSVIKADGVSLLSSLYSWLKAHNDSSSTHDGTGEKILNGGNGIDWTTATDV